MPTTWSTTNARHNPNSLCANNRGAFILYNAIANDYGLFRFKSATADALDNPATAPRQERLSVPLEDLPVRGPDFLDVAVEEVRYGRRRRQRQRLDGRRSPGLLVRPLPAYDQLGLGRAGDQSAVAEDEKVTFKSAALCGIAKSIKVLSWLSSYQGS